MSHTPEQPEGFPTPPPEPDPPAGIAARLLLLLTPFVLAGVVWWLFARLG